MTTVKYKNFLILQYYISIEDILQREYDYEGLKTTFSSTFLNEVMSLEEFVCMVWKKDFYECDKYNNIGIKEENRGLIYIDDLPKNDDFLIDIEPKNIKLILNKYLKKRDSRRLDVNLEAINSCYVLSSNKNYIFEDRCNFLDILSVIFKDDRKVYMIEVCKDC